MQPITRQMEEAVRSSYQAPLARLEVYNQDGSLAGTINDVEDLEINVAGSRKVLRTFSAKINNDQGQYSPDPDQFERNFLWYNKTVKVFYGYYEHQGKIRYIRDWLNGSTANTSNHWVEIQALDPAGVNVAQGKTVTASTSISDPTRITNGNTYTTDYAGIGPGKNYVQVDLGALFEIEKVKVWHYWSGGRTYYQTKTEVSADGIHWIPVFDSAIQGEYPETSEGVTHMIHEQWLPQGVFTIDYIKPEIKPDGITLEMGGQDLGSKMIEDKFDDTYAVQDAAATESANYATSGTASASSYVQSGDEIQTQARIHYVDHFATINGVAAAVENDKASDPKNMINGTVYPDFIQEWSSQPYSLAGTTVNSNAAGILNVTSSNIDPMINMFSIGSWDPSVYRYIKIRYRVLSGSAGNTEIFFLNSTYLGANQAAALSKGMISDGQWHVLTLDMWSHPYWKTGGNITGWRYDWATASGVNMELDYIGLFKDDTQSDQKDYVFQYIPGPGETVSQIEAEIFVDLQSAEDLNNITLNFANGSQLTDFVYTSSDNQSWSSVSSTSFDPSGLVRYIKFKVRKLTAEEDGSWLMGMAEIQIKTAANFPATNANDADVYGSHWRPKAAAADPDPKLTIDFGSLKSVNALYLYWGNNAFDFWNRVQYYLEYSTNNSTWIRISDLNELDETVSLFGDVEHVFDTVSARYIRINIKGRDGVAKLRHVKANNISATQTVDKVIKDVAATAGITKVKIPKTRRYVDKQQAEIGDEKISFCNKIAGSMGWVDIYWDEDGYMRTGPRDINPVDPAWSFDVETDNIFGFSPRFSNDIYNVIVVVGKSSSDKAIVGRAQDDDPLSPTYIGTLGRRVRKYEGDSYKTQDIVDQIAAQRLFERTRFKHQTSLPVTGHPGLQHDDVIRVNVPEAKVDDSLYVITGFVTTFSAESAQFDSTINISQL